MLTKQQNMNQGIEDIVDIITNLPCVSKLKVIQTNQIKWLVSLFFFLFQP